MMRLLACVMLALVLSPTVVPQTAEAGWRNAKGKYSKKHNSKRRYSKRRRSKRRRAQVRGFRARRGGYSYKANDVVNTYGNNRSLFGSVNAYRDPFTDRQTTAGPFDHGWFFDSAVAPRGGDSPYLQ